MSYSMRLAEEPPECECRYDEARDEMDRDDCPFHCDLPGEPGFKAQATAKRKQPAAEASTDEAVA
jgi:hypothetical protein